MPKGVSAKGYKMTQNRKDILTILVEEGGALKSKEGRATSLMHGLLRTSASVASVNASLKELENLGFIERDTEARSTFALRITPEGKQVLVDEGVMTSDEVASVDLMAALEAQAQTTETELVPAAVNNNGASAGQVPVPNAPTVEAPAIAAVPEEEWDWTTVEAASETPGGIDYDILLAVFLKAALRGMEADSSNSEEVSYHKQQAVLAAENVERLEHEVDKLRAEAAQAIAQRDQLEKNLNVLMARFEKKTNTRGSDPIRKLLSQEEVQALDALMRQMPTRRGE